MSNDPAKGRKISGFYLTRAGRVVLACILVAVAIWPVGIQPQATQAAPAYAPQTPTPPAPSTPTPALPPLAGEGAAAQAPHTPLSPDNLPPEAEEVRVRQAAGMALAKYAKTYGSPYEMTITKVTVEGEWATVVVTPEGGGQPFTLLARRGQDGAWQVVGPGERDVYATWLETLESESIITSTTALSDKREQTRRYDLASR